MASLWSIRRSVDDVKVAGVCGGVARHWGIDPVLVRVGWVLLAFSGGLGVVLYLAGWLLIPQDGQIRSTLDNLTGGATTRWSREARLAMVVIACVVVLAVTGSLTPFGFGPAVVLALIWYFGYYRNRRRQSAPPPNRPPDPALDPPVSEPFRYPGPATPFTEAAAAWQRRMAEHLGQTLPPVRPAQPAPPAPSMPPSVSAPRWPSMPTAERAPVQDPTPEHLEDAHPLEDARHAAYLSVPDPVGLYAEPSSIAAAVPSRRVRAQAPAARRLRLIGLIALGLTLSGLGLANAQGAQVPVSGFLAAGLLVIGLTLIAATWLGRARGILPLGVVVATALLLVSVSSPGGMPRDWVRTADYNTAADVPRGGDQLEVGELTVDLRDLAITEDLSYAAHVDAGRLVVKSPTATNVRVRYSVDQGVVVVDGTTVASGDRDGVVEPTDPVAGRPTLTLDLSTDIGEVRVER